jgi:hypothetical protein
MPLPLPLYPLCHKGLSLENFFYFLLMGGSRVFTRVIWLLTDNVG